MHSKRIIIMLFLSLAYSLMIASDKKNSAINTEAINIKEQRVQEPSTTKQQVVDERSLKFYNEGKWSSLLDYGKTSIKNGIDFPYLRMRTGYAAFMLGKYAESLKQYTFVYNKDKKNESAAYFCYVNNLYLNNALNAHYYASKLSDTTLHYYKINRFKLSSVSTEFSYKWPGTLTRSNASYGRVGLNAQLGHRTELQISGAFYTQTINEPLMTSVTNNEKIAIKQNEYYLKSIFAITGKTSFIAGYHQINTPFNNYSYHNQIGFAGIQYNRPYIHYQAMAHYGTISDSAYHQYDLSVSTYPHGDTKMYTITTASYGKKFALTQVAGYKVEKYIWLEINATFGKYNILLGNDNLYLFNDIDTKIFNAGCSGYIFIEKKIMLTLNYNFAVKQLFKTTNNFNQHSITGGLQWNF